MKVKFKMKSGLNREKSVIREFDNDATQEEIHEAMSQWLWEESDADYEIVEQGEEEQ